MLQMIILVLADVELLESVVEAWYDHGAPGITVMHSVGLEQLDSPGRRDDLPLFPSINDLFDREEVHHRVIFTVVDRDELVERLIRVTENLTGDLSNAGNGILFVIPVALVRGLRQRH